MHENLERENDVDRSSDRSFGLVFAGIFVVIGCWPLLHGAQLRWWSFGVALVLATLALVAPAVLAVPNRVWTAFGILLAKVVAPIACAVLFFAGFLPIGLIMRLGGKDSLRLKRDPAAPTYWIPRTPPGPAPDSLTQQF
jgi:hypothetical protein